ncbi:MAG: VOC family protein [Xanthomonadales bacterium]|nr:VOC family protein [Xanthomonadales bacterium]
MQHAHRNALNWFEIPVADLDRAQRFYEALLDAPLKREAMGPDTTLAVFPYERGAGIGGCLFAGTHAPAPSDDGTVVYLDASPALDTVLSRVEAAGGLIVLPRTELPEGMGAFAQIVDSEGNRVGLHALA